MKERYDSILYNGCGTQMLIVVIMLILMAFTSCATKKKVVETEHTTIEVSVDSTNVQSIKKDSADTTHKTNVDEKEKVETETKVEKSDSTVMTIDTNGNVIKQETWHKEKETVSRNREYEKQLRDSIARFQFISDSLKEYKSQCDSLKEKLLHKEFVTVEKQKIPKLFWASMVFSILVIIFAFVKLVRWLQIR